ncbi:MAG: MFS transporter [Betaproteobacteria bacterium]|nr:MAG: MFS transporter [Betaproteobacteria bacterium]
MIASARRFAAGILHGSPLAHSRFRRFYAGSVGAALGYTMQGTIAAWLMATLTPSALMVALVQTASTGPALLFGLAAGALADIVDRRRIVLVTQALLVGATSLLGLAALAGLVTPVTLLAFTFVIGAGFTIYLPAAQATTNDLVPRAELPRAVALGAVAFNVSRAAGPALAGALTAWIGTGSALVAASLCFVLMVVAIRRLRIEAPVLPGVPEKLFPGMASGVRYVRHSPLMRAFLLRNLSFSVCGGALWALLPVIARDLLGMGAGGFGLLSASFGLGAVLGALTIPRLLQRRSLNDVVLGASLLWATAVVAVAFVHATAVALAAMFACGAAWVGVLASLSAGVQSAAPAWVRARAVAASLVVNQGSLAAGAALWGAVASAADIPTSLGLSAVALLALLLVNRRQAVRLGSESEVTPGAPLPDLGLPMVPRPDDGPVLIQQEFRVAPENHEAFLRAIHAVEPARRRNGASDWRVFRDLADANLFVERYIIESWAEYVRLRNRMTVADRELTDRVQQLQLADVPIRVSRLIGITALELPAFVDEEREPDQP